MKRGCAIFVLIIFAYPVAAGSPSTAERKEGPFLIHRIAIDPQNPQTLYAATSNYGILKSTDGGTTWGLSNQGLRSYTHHAVVVNPVDPNILYVGAWGGGVSKSVDRGIHWTEMNDGLGNTAIEDLVLDPVNPERLYVATTSGVFKSPDGGTRWMSYSTGLPVSQIEIFECLIALPSGPIELFLGTSQGLFKRERNAAAWEAVSGVDPKEHITVFALEPKRTSLFAGTIKNGLLQSRDEGKNWTPVGGKIEKTWVSDIALDPRHPGVIYASTRSNGILKSRDGGATWEETSQGLPVNDIRSLCIDPTNPMILYAGTTYEGLAKTLDGGGTWVRLSGYPQLSMTEIVASLSAQPRQPKDASPPVPPEFVKCNQCHGWGDTYLNSKRTYWRVPPNRRNWGLTIGRMTQRARLTPEESNKIIEFLTRYTMGKP